MSSPPSRVATRSRGSSHTLWEHLPFWKRGNGACFSDKPDRLALAPW